MPNNKKIRLTKLGLTHQRLRNLKPTVNAFAGPCAIQYIQHRKVRKFWPDFQDAHYAHIKYDKKNLIPLA